VFLRLIVLLAFLVSPLAMTGCVIVPISLPSPPSVQEVVYERGSGWRPKKIAIIDISGVLTSGRAGDGWFSSDSSVVDLSKKLKMAENDNQIEAVILRINTPGGGVTASDIMYRMVKDFREETGKPVYVSMQSMSTSGGYYVAMGGDEIYASPTTVTGSIGVIATFPEIRGLMDKIGLEMNAITSGRNKDAGAFYKEMSDDDRALYQSMVDEFYNRFVDVVAENRTNLNRNDLEHLADGRIYTGPQAYEAGLVDGVAYLDELIEIVKDEQSLRRPRVVILTRTNRNTAESPYAGSKKESAPQASTGSIEVNLMRIDAQELLNPAPEAFNYLWVP